jgi:hypothetical protein
VEALDGLIRDNPTLVAGTVLVFQGLLTFVYVLVKRELHRMEQHEKKQDVAILGIQKKLASYDITFAVSKTSFDDLAEAIRNHIKKEADIPKAIAGIQADVAWIRGRINDGK